MKKNLRLIALANRIRRAPVPSNPSAMTIALTIRIGGLKAESVENENPEKKQYVETSWRPAPSGGTVGGYGE
jgi:hypothetical protein